MSTFKRILAEKTRRDYGRKGGQGGTQSTSSTPYKRGESKAKLDNPQKYQTPARGPRQVIPSPQQGIDGLKLMLLAELFLETKHQNKHLVK